MEAASTAAAMEIIDSGCSTPYMTAPSSPPRFFSQFGHNPSLKDANFTLPPPSSSSSPKHFPGDIDFAFSFAGKFHDSPLTAEDLFHHGKIKPLKSVVVINTDHSDTDHDFKTANSSPRRRNVFHDAFASSPRRKRKDIDLVTPSSDDDGGGGSGSRSAKREFNKPDKTQSFNPTKARSVSAPPFQLSQMLFDEEQGRVKTAPKTSSTTSFWTSFSLTKAYRKWKLKDLLFRSASEGRSTDKVAVDPALMSYSVLTKSKSREATASFRSSSDGSSSMKGSGRVPVSAHELHYTVNRAVSEEMKRKTYLPYKQSLLGCLGFNPSGHQFPGRAGSMTRV